MNSQELKSLLKSNQDKIRTSSMIIEVDGKKEIFKTLKSFGNVILDLESRDLDYSMTVFKNEEPVNEYTTTEAIQEALNEGFDKISIWAYKIDMYRAIEEFGTAA
ncbi:MAG TPA: hypothetical protein VIO43_12210 [Lutibacter sp.]